MIIKMLTGAVSDRKNKKVTLSKSLTSEPGKAQLFRGLLNQGGRVTALADQDSLITLSMANCLIEINEKIEKLNAGDQVNILMIN
jgi:molybdopterin biosynthesis enzyme